MSRAERAEARRIILTFFSRLTPTIWTDEDGDIWAAHAEATDEGWRRTTVSVRAESGGFVVEHTTRERDCDGTHANGDTYTYRRMSRPKPRRDYCGLPVSHRYTVTSGDAYQRDAYAEAAGY